MNYRHVYHAGNFADVVKHAVLARIVEYLKRKDGAFRVIDTHAGRGIYRLDAEEARKTSEADDGIARLLGAKIAVEARALLDPYLEIVRGLNAEGALDIYPGSPLLTRRLLRRQDRLTAIELHSEDATALRRLFEGDHQVRVLELDGWLSLGAHLPPKEKRGLVLVDPPFEREDEFGRILDGLRKAHRRWPGGTYAVWYPIKDRRAVGAFREALKRWGVPGILDTAFHVRKASPSPRLDGSGMIVVNPPYLLEAELKVLLPALRRILSDGDAPMPALTWLTPAA